MSYDIHVLSKMQSRGKQNVNSRSHIYNITGYTLTFQNIIVELTAPKPPGRESSLTRQVGTPETAGQTTLLHTFALHVALWTRGRNVIWEKVTRKKGFENLSL